MGISFFCDKMYRPSDAEIEAAVGPRLGLWQAMMAYLDETYAADKSLEYLYGKGYGWAWRFRVRRQVLVSLYPTDGGFTAQVNLSPKAVDEALEMELGENVKQVISRAKPAPEGRWLFIPMESEQDLVDLKTLIGLRVRHKRL